MTNLAYQTYQKNQVETAAPEKLVIILYDGLIRFLSAAEDDINNKKMESAHENIIRAQDIINELRNNLDFKAGGIADSLYAIYDYIYRKLVQANLKKTTSPIREASDLIKELRSAWKEAVLQYSSENKQVRDVG